MNQYEEILKLIAKDPEKILETLNLELSMPNIPTPTSGGETFWNNLAEFNGWRLQQNMITKHARILRPNDVRVAWGTVNGMYKALDRLVASLGDTRYSKVVSNEERTKAVAKLKELKELLDIGAITQEEFDEKKAKLIDLI